MGRATVKLPRKGAVHRAGRLDGIGSSRSTRPGGAALRGDDASSAIASKSQTRTEFRAEVRQPARSRTRPGIREALERSSSRLPPVHTASSFAIVTESSALLIVRRCESCLLFKRTVDLIHPVRIALLAEQSRTVHPLQERFIELEASVGHRRLASLRGRHCRFFRRKSACTRAALFP